MAQEPPSSSQTLESVIHHDDLQQPASTVTSSSSDTNNPTLTRNVSSSRLNAKAPEFVPRTTTAASSPSSSSTTTSTTVTTRADLSQPRLVISPPPTSPGIIHVYPSPNSPFHPPIPTHVPVSVPVQNHHPHHHHHHVPLQYHHHQHHNHTHNHNHPRPFNGATGFLDHKDVSVQAQRTVLGDPDSKDGLTDEATQKILNQVEYYFSDINLATTDHLMRFINKDPEGYGKIHSFHYVRNNQNS